MTLFLLAQLWHFARQSGQVSGFDAGDFLYRVKLANEGNLNPDLHSAFWAYHPPVIFWLVRQIQVVFHVDDVRSIQIVTQGAALISFFALRETLRSLKLLATASGIAFLYLASSIPIVVNASTSLNMDIVVLAFTCVVLLCAVGLWEPSVAANLTPISRGLLAGAILFVLTVGLYSKFSSLLIGVVPFLVIMAQTGNLRSRMRPMAMAAVLVLVPILLASPYYYQRYYRATGLIFPNVNEWWYAEELKSARATRDADRTQFLHDLLLPSPADRNEQRNARDKVHVRLEDTWRDLWFKDPELGDTAENSIRWGRGYAWVFGIGMAFGSIALIRRWRQHTLKEETWRRLGGILLPYGLMQFASLLFFIYQQPMASCIPGKCLYILPVTWGIAYLVASVVPSDPDEKHPAALVLLVATGVIILASALVPVY